MGYGNGQCNNQDFLCFIKKNYTSWSIKLHLFKAWIKVYIHQDLSLHLNVKGCFQSYLSIKIPIFCYQFHHFAFHSGFLSLVLCKVVEYIVCIVLMRSFHLLFYYMYLRADCNCTFILIMCADVFSTLHNYHSFRFPYSQNSCFYDTVTERTNYCFTLEHSLLYIYMNNIINKHSLYEVDI